MTIEQLPHPEVHGGGCGCGEHDVVEPTIDATAIPHRLRHAAVLGAAQSMNAGESFIIRAPHLPRPLLAQIAQLPGEWTFEVIVDGPEKVSYTNLRAHETHLAISYSFLS